MSAVLVLVLRVGMAAALYAFLGWAVYIIWKEFRQQSQSVANNRIPEIALFQIGETESQGCRFTQSELIVGRDPTCDYPISDETVTARHARLSYHHRQWWVEDLRSTNGSFLNQEPLSTPTVIISGDELRCGQITLIVTIK